VNACHTRQKSNGLSGEKRDATFHLRVLRYASDHAVFPVATINDVILKALKKLSLRNIVKDNNKLTINVVNPEKENPVIVDAIVGVGGHVQYVTALNPTLEDAYLKFVRETK